MAAARELRIWVDDRPGVLGKISEVLGASGINIVGFAVWESTAHVLTDAPERSAALLIEAGFKVEVVDVLRLVVPDEPGNLAEIAQELGEAAINIDHAYSVSNRADGAAALVLAVPDIALVGEILE
jgi:hypothetical protein